MKRTIAAAFAALVAASALFAQTTIDKPVATISLTRKEVISQRQFKADIDKVESSTGQKLGPEQRRQVLEGKIDIALFIQYCEREKIAVSDGDVSKALDQLRQQAGTGTDDAKLELALRAQGVVLDPKTYVRQQLLLRAYLQAKKANELKAIKEPTADEILKAYELQKSQLVRPDTVRVSILYVDFRSLSDDAKKKGADALRQAAAQVRTNPAKFDEFALKASDPSSSYKSSANFYVEKTPQSIQVYGQLFVDQVFKMKAGDISDVLENEAGIQVVRVNEILPQKLLTLTDPLPGNPNATVQDYIRYALGTQRQNEVLAKIQSDLHDELRKAATVTIYEENLKF